MVTYTNGVSLCDFLLAVSIMFCIFSTLMRFSIDLSCYQRERERELLLVFVSGYPCSNLMYYSVCMYIRISVFSPAFRLLFLLA